MVFTNTKRHVYDGNFANGKLEGEGSFTYESGNRYSRRFYE
ncbi:MAG: hypothetical protein IPP38_10045 [Bacteroidetes bacterium]|nr:hypothetical protein [Bacteroidota bacterium]